MGTFGIYRQEVRSFTSRQIALVANFAAQAVIAIENTRLLNELRQRTGDLSEALERQTATSEVLEIISSSPGELEPVFETMLANAVRICEAKFGTMIRAEEGGYRTAAMHGERRRPGRSNERRRNPCSRSDQQTHFSASPRRGQLQHIADIRADRAFHDRDRAFVSVGRRCGCPDPACRPDAQGRRTGRRNLPSTARRCARSPTNRSNWYRISPPRPSSPSRTRGFSASCANLCSSRPPPPMCSRSSPVRPYA